VNTSEEQHQLLGLYILGGLDRHERAAFEEHLADCLECRRDAAELESLPDLLDALPRDAALDLESPPPHELEERTRELVDELALRRRKERRRWTGLVAAVAGVCLVAGASVGPLLAQQLQPASDTYTMTADGGLQVELALVNKTWGTEMDVAGEKLPQDGILTLWVTGKSGYTYQVASWQATPAGRATLTASCAMNTDEIAKVELRNDADATLAAVSTN
jgi:hypothetical protein